MTRNLFLLSCIATMASNSQAFAPTIARRPASALSSSVSMEQENAPFFADVQMNSKTQLPLAPVAPATPPPVPKKAAKGGKGGAIHKNGLLSPVVQLSKIVIGEPKLNKLRAKVISLHSDVIGGFVETSHTETGNFVLKQLFEISDKNGDGTIDEDELNAALKTLGFDWLKEKQVKGIFARADKDKSGAIDLEEWIKEAPKTLRTNLVKLAKKNGSDMGLLV